VHRERERDRGGRKNIILQTGTAPPLGKCLGTVDYSKPSAQMLSSKSTGKGAREDDVFFCNTEQG